jgi:S1-C subfamily serine protease
MSGATAMRAVIAVLAFQAVTAAAPVPADPPPDPLGLGYMGVYRDETNTLKIARVVEGSAAQKAGLLPDDVFVRVGPITGPKNFEEIRTLIIGLRPGTEVAVSVRRGSELKHVVITLAPKPPENELLVDPFNP